MEMRAFLLFHSERLLPSLLCEIQLSKINAVNDCKVPLNTYSYVIHTHAERCSKLARALFVNIKAYTAVSSNTYEHIFPQTPTEAFCCSSHPESHPHILKASLTRARTRCAPEPVKREARLCFSQQNCMGGAKKTGLFNCTKQKQK